MNHYKNVQYYVEGDDEKKLLNVFKSEMQIIVSGKIQKFNVIEEKFRSTHLMQLKPNTDVILVFDTDTGNDIILRENIQFLHDSETVKSVICITQVKNLEDELIRSCNIKNIKELLGSKSRSDYKTDLIRVNNLKAKLEKHKFNYSLFWSQRPDSVFSNINNEANRIKK